MADCFLICFKVIDLFPKIDNARHLRDWENILDKPGLHALVLSVDVVMTALTERVSMASAVVFFGWALAFWRRDWCFVCFSLRWFMERGRLPSVWKVVLLCLCVVGLLYNGFQLFG